MFVEKRIEDLQLNPMTMFGKEWMALTAGNEKNGYNTMTVAWGHLGPLGNRGTQPTVFLRQFVMYAPAVIQRSFWSGRLILPYVPLTLKIKRYGGILAVIPAEIVIK